MKLVQGLVIFAGGLLIGTVSGYQVAKKRYVAIKEQQIEELKRMGEIKEEYRTGKTEENDEEKPEESRESGILSSETRSALKHLRKKNNPKDRVPYDKYYGNDGVDPAEKESPEEIAETHLEHIDDPPELVDEEALGEVPAWVETETLFYYVAEDHLVDEDEEDVVNPEYHVGDILKNFDWGSEDYGNILYIWNHAFDTLYEVNLL